MSTRNNTRRRSAMSLIALPVVIGALAFAGCGSDDDPAAEATSTTEAPASTTGEDAPGQVAISADAGGSLAYDQDSVSATSGKVTIAFENPSSIVHDVAIEDSAGEQVAATDRVTNGSTETTARLEPGSYTFYCSVTGHRGAGMEGTLEVE